MRVLQTDGTLIRAEETSEYEKLEVAEKKFWAEDDEPEELPFCDEDWEEGYYGNDDLLDSPYWGI